MTKSKFKTEAKGMGNSVRVINGITIANVCWLNNPWRIVETGTDFDTASKREYTPIASYHTLQDLIDAQLV